MQECFLSYEHGKSITVKCTRKQKCNLSSQQSLNCNHEKSTTIRWKETKQQKVISPCSFSLALITIEMQQLHNAIKGTKSSLVMQRSPTWAIWEGHWVIIRKPDTIIGTKVVLLRPHGKGITIMADKGTKDGIRILGTIGSTINGVHRELACMSCEGREQQYDTRYSLLVVREFLRF